MIDWKEIEDIIKSCSDENGLCGNCREHSEDLNERDYPDHSWGDE